MWQRVRQFLSDAGRAVEAFPKACLAYFNVTNDRELGKREAMTALTRYYGPQFASWYDPERALIFGPPDECARKAQAYLHTGAQHLILVPTTLDVQQVDRVSREVVPLLTADRRKGHSRPLRFPPTVSLTGIYIQDGPVDDVLPGCPADVRIPRS